MGQWNERNAPPKYAAALRAAVANSTRAGLTTVLERLPHYPGTTDHPDPRGCTQYKWNTTAGSRWVDEEGSIWDGPYCASSLRVPSHLATPIPRP